MKKRIYLLLIFVISFFAFNSYVSAAKELACMYHGNKTIEGYRKQSNTQMIIQTSDGDKYYFIAGSNDISDFNDQKATWTLYSNVNLNLNGVSVYDSSARVLSSCPQYVSAAAISNNDRNSVSFSDNDVSNDMFSLAKSTNNIDDLPSGVVDIIENSEGSSNDIDQSDEVDFYTSTDYSEKINNTEWLGECVYSQSTNSKKKVYLYFNDNEFLIDTDEENDISAISRARFSVSDLKSFSDSFSNCPIRIFGNFNVKDTANEMKMISEYYLYKKNGSYTLYLDSSSSKWNGPTIDSDDNGEINNCNDLLGEDIIEGINKVMSYIRIIVPILLIGFGVFDFTTAVFSGKEDDMSKQKSKFIKRIVAAFIVFIIPIFINLILDVANKVWDVINPDTCIK